MSSIPRFKIIPPSTLTITVGTAIGGGDIRDIQNWNDGNVLQIQEAAGIPGYDIEMLFEGVNSILEVAIFGYYVGSSTHYVNIQMYDYDASAWLPVGPIETSLSLHCYESYLPTDSAFINGSNQAKVRLYHPVSGNASHDLYIACIGLLY